MIRRWGAEAILVAFLAGLLLYGCLLSSGHAGRALSAAPVRQRNMQKGLRPNA